MSLLHNLNRTAPRRVRLTGRPSQVPSLLLSPMTISNYFYNSLDFFIDFFTIYISVFNQIYQVFKLFENDVILYFLHLFPPSIVFLRFMHGLQSQTFWVCIQALLRNCWVALSKLCNLSVFQLLFCKIGIIIVPTVGLLEE